MKKKKILARIGAMIAVALIVASLAIPAFADTSAPNDETIANNAFSAYRASLPTSVKNDAFYLLYSKANSNLAFMSYEFLASGSVNLYSMLERPNVAQRATIVYEGSPHIAIVASGANGSFNFVQDSQGEITVGVVLYESGGSDISVLCYDGISTYCNIYYSYDTTQQQYAFVAIQYQSNGETVAIQNTELHSLQIALATVYGNNEQELFSLLSSLFFYPVASARSSPYWFYHGFTQPFEDAYTLGYTEGINTIEDGEFGNQFLGSVFRAPFDAMRQFTLIEWTTQNGGTVTITLANIVSAGIGVALFIWFLKLFAGG